MEDAQIIALYFARDERAIRETDEKYGKICLHIANNILDNEEDSKECLNDTYLSVWNQIPPTHPQNFMAFVCKIVRNLALKKLEYLYAKKRTQNAVVSLSELEIIFADRRVESAMDDEEIGKAISNFLRKEKEDVRNVFIRRYWYFDSVSDIAKRYGFSESKVKSMLHHTRNRMRKYLEKEGVWI